MEETGQTESRKDFAEPKLVSQWLAEIKAYEKTYDAWTKQCKAIVKRYRNEASGSFADDGMTAAQPEFNVLWSNVQTMAPIVYSRTPKASISRKWKDKNIIGRAAAVILERATQSEIDGGGFDSAMRGGRDDYLLTARGQVWYRYVPTYGEETRDRIFLQADTKEDGRKVYRKPDEEEPLEFEEGEGPEMTDDGLPYLEEGEPYRPVVAECVKQEHTPWERFGHTPAPNWIKVRGVWKGEPMTRDQLRERFGNEKADKVELKLKVPGVSDADIQNYGDVFKRALVYEVWDRTTGKVLWICEGMDEPLDVIDDPLKLKDFFPCPCPLFGTTTTDSLVPVPDYMQYRGQAERVDELEVRIGLLVEAVRVAGVYAGEQNKEIEALVSRRGENKLIPVDAWAALAEKGGLRGVIDWLPIEQVVAAIETLIRAQGVLLDKIYQITGLSDIVRGQATGAGEPAATATEQRIKGQYAGLRISDRQLATERFARDGVQITAEIIAEHFSPETLYEISGWEFSDEAGALDTAYAEWEQAAQQAQAEYQAAVQEYQASVMGGGPPPMPTGEGGEQAPPQPPAPPEIPPPPPQSREIFDQAVELLRSDRARGFTIEIETDSMVLEDQQQEAQNRTDLLEKVTGYLAAAPTVMEQSPALGPLLGEFLLWTMRGHKISRDMEAHVEQAWESLTNTDPAEAAEDPAAAAMAEIEGQKVQIEQAKVEADNARNQADAQIKGMKAQSDVERAQADAQLKAMQMQLDAAHKEREAALKQTAMQIDAHKQARSDEMKAYELKLKEMDIAARSREANAKLVIDAAALEESKSARREAAAKADLAPPTPVKEPAAEKPSVDSQILPAVVEALGRLGGPRRVVRDENGRVAGVE